MKLNLGCGQKHLPDFVNVDIADNWADNPPDVAADITKALPFDDDSADEIHAYHVVEHIFRWEVEGVLRDWFRVLKPGGKMVLELPCLDKILWLFSKYQEAKSPVDARLTLWGLYGDPGYKNPDMTHKWCYAMSELQSLMQGIGLREVIIMEPQTHVALRDMRLEGTK